VIPCPRQTGAATVERLVSHETEGAILPLPPSIAVAIAEGPSANSRPKAPKDWRTPGLARSAGAMGGPHLKFLLSGHVCKFLNRWDSVIVAFASSTRVRKPGSRVHCRPDP